MKNIFDELNHTQSWGKTSLSAAIQTALSRSLRTDVRAVALSSVLFAFHINLTKFYNPTFNECLIFLVSTSPNITQKDIKNLLEEVETIVRDQQLLGHPCIYLLFNGAINLLDYFEDAFPNSYIGSDNDFKLIIIDDDNKSRTNLIEMLSLHGLDMTKCPFHYLGPVQPDMFVGRENLITEILGWNQKAYAIPGGRRIGKSSLLLKIKSEAQKIRNDDGKEKYHVLYIDCSNFQSFDSLIEEIERKLSPKSYFDFLRKSRSFDFATILERFGGIDSKTLMLLLDEMDPLIKVSKERNEDSLYFANIIRSIANKDQLRLVISGFLNVFEMVQDSNHPFYNLCHNIKLSVLEEKDIRKLLVRPFLRLGISFADQNEIISRINNLTSGHPSVVQLIARELYRTRKNDTITLQDLDRVIRTSDLIDFVLDNFMMNTSSLERFICTLFIQSETLNLDEVIEKVSQSRLQLKDQDKKLYLALRNLIFTNILTHDQGRYKFLYPLMQSIIREYYVTPNVIQGLKREIEEKQNV